MCGRQTGARVRAGQASGVWRLYAVTVSVLVTRVSSVRARAANDLSVKLYNHGEASTSAFTLKTLLGQAPKHGKKT